VIGGPSSHACVTNYALSVVAGASDNNGDGDLVKLMAEAHGIQACTECQAA
jgi:hypothetical protein